MEGVIPNQMGAKSRVTDVIGRYPGVIPLVVAVILGLVVIPAIANAVKDHDVQINGRISLINVIWLGVAIVLSIVCLVARSSLSRELGETLRKIIVGTESTETPSRRSGSSTQDLPALGVGIVRGLFDLLLLLIVQGIVRAPLVGVVEAYQPRAIVDGAFVALVVLIALIMLFGLNRMSRPLTEHLVTVGLDRVVPTAGFAASNLPDSPAPRTITRTPVPSRASSEPTVAPGVRAPSSDAPTIAAAATVAASAEATVADPRGMAALSAEATIAAPVEAPPTPSSPAVVPAWAGEATVLESPPMSIGSASDHVADIASVPEAAEGSPREVIVANVPSSAESAAEATSVAPSEPSEPSPLAGASSPSETVVGASSTSGNAERTIIPDKVLDETLAEDATIVPSSRDDRETGEKPSPEGRAN